MEEYSGCVCMHGRLKGSLAGDGKQFAARRRSHSLTLAAPDVIARWVGLQAHVTAWGRSSSTAGAATAVLHDGKLQPGTPTTADVIACTAAATAAT